MSNITNLSMPTNQTFTLNDSAETNTSADGTPFRDTWPYFQLYGHGYWTIALSIAVIGAIGNVLQIFMMSDEKLRCLSYSVYLKFLAVSDTLLLVGVLFEETENNFELVNIVDYSSGLCKSLNGFRFGTMLLSPWLVVGLSLDRYVCICFPLTRERFCTIKKATIVCSTMVTIAILFNVPVFVTLYLKEGQCDGPENITYYFAFLRLAISSMIPCIAILVLNIAIIVDIQRSNQFRNTFLRNGVDTAKDSSTRPLVLISVFAFATLLPISISESVSRILEIIDAMDRARLLGRALWPVFNLIYLLNFGQNFYILLATGRNYRDIMIRKFQCFEKARKTSVSSPQTNGSACSVKDVTVSVVGENNMASTSLNPNP